MLSSALSRHRKKETITAKKIIAADGVNSRTVQSLGMNEGRPCFATALCIIYSLENVRDFEPTAMRWHMGRAYHSFGPVILDPSLRGTASCRPRGHGQRAAPARADF